MKFFRENYDLFELAYMTEVNGKRFMFSHAGISKYWLKNNEQFFGTDVSDSEKILALLDNGLKLYKQDAHNDALLRVLAQIGMGRGGRYLDGSMIWADLDEYVSDKSFPWDDVIQILGHTTGMTSLSMQERWNSFVRGTICTPHQFLSL